MEDAGSNRSVELMWFLFLFFLILYIHIGRNLSTGRYFPKWAGMAETDWNGPDFNLRWNRRVFRTGSLTDMKFSGRNGTDSSTMAHMACKDTLQRDCHTLLS